MIDAMNISLFCGLQCGLPVLHLALRVAVGSFLCLLYYGAFPGAVGGCVGAAAFSQSHYPEFAPVRGGVFFRVHCVWRLRQFCRASAVRISRISFEKSEPC